VVTKRPLPGGYGENRGSLGSLGSLDQILTTPHAASGGTLSDGLNLL
jgi:hypothetical protein